MSGGAEGYLMGYRELLGRLAAWEDRMAEEEALTGIAPDRGKGEALFREAEAKKRELLRFIETIGEEEDERTRRLRKALRLYYCELLSWGEVRGLLRPLVLRKGSPEMNLRKGAGISKTAMLRVREEALMAAEEAIGVHRE